MKKQRQRGAVLVEFAVAMPILLFLLVGVVDFGLILREYALLQNGAREGVRLSVLPNYEIAAGLTAGDQTARRDAIRQRVVDYLAGEGITISISDVTVTQTDHIDLGGGTNAWASTVTATYTRSLLIGNGWPYGPTVLRGTAKWRNLY